MSPISTANRDALHKQTEEIVKFLLDRFLPLQSKATTSPGTSLQTSS